MRLGFIVNPIAGMGGKVGLKGTDDTLEEALARGAEQVAPSRATEFLKKLKRNMTEKSIEVIACPGIMGEEEARETDFHVQVLPMKIGEETTAEDTKTAVDLLAGANVDLIVFVGGDGTAKDILDAMQDCRQVPVLGVPSGVKMYSGIFAVNPSDAVEVVLAYSEGRAEITELEVMDSNEKAIRRDVFELKLHGFLKGPFLPARIAGTKQVSPETDDETDNQMAIARFVLEQVPTDATWILGPGTTVKRVADLLGVEKTVLGVDICRRKKAIQDVDERRILQEVEDWKNVWIVLSPIGHQGILLGRGNQQISPKIVKRVGKERIIVAATKSKLQNISGKVLRVDSGDPETDKMLKGYIRVITDYKEWRLMQVQ
ncbi:MAG TPA: ATP-NAD kinase family protein [Candidatus Acidoferrales bacterium]|nr:ATP-NAD kinase family protein [Candidatus Acidoferrales bacterium]